MWPPLVASSVQSIVYHAPTLVSHARSAEARTPPNLVSILYLTHFPVRCGRGDVCAGAGRPMVIEQGLASTR